MSDGTARKKKGLSPLAWVAIGCLGLLLVAGLAVTVGTAFFVKKAKDFAENIEQNPARTVGKTFAAVHPDIEFVDADEDAGTVTFRKAGTTDDFTVDVQQLRDGNFSITGPDGKIEFRADGEGGITGQDADGTTRIGASAQDGGLTISGADGEPVARLGTGAVADLPEGLSLYPGAQVASSYSSTQNNRSGGAVTLTTEDSLDDVVTFYEGVFERGGYTVNNRTRSTQGTTEVAVLSGTNPEGEVLSLMASSEGGKTQAVVTYGDG